MLAQVPRPAVTAPNQPEPSRLLPSGSELAASFSRPPPSPLGIALRAAVPRVNIRFIDPSAENAHHLSRRARHAADGHLQQAGAAFRM